MCIRDRFTCPSDGGTRKTYIHYSKLPKSSENNWGSYATNTAYWDTGPGQSPSSDISSKQTITISMVQKPAETVWAGDANGSFQVAWPNIKQQATIIEGSPRVLGLKGASILPHEGGWVARHQDKLNIVWADGHAGATSLDRLITPALDGPTKGAYKYFTIEDD